jgi:hypothetical protein
MFLDRHLDKWTPLPNGCWIWTAAINNARRPMVGVAGNKVALVSRVVCEEAYGPPPSLKHQAAHATPSGCFGDLCVAPHHLRWATNRENQADIPAVKRSERTKQAWTSREPEERDNHRNRARNLARLAGERTYLSGKLCKNGHAGPRLTSSGDCLECRSSWNSQRVR